MKRKLKAIGYWKSIFEPEFPDPTNFEDSNWNVKDKELVLEHLGRGKSIADWMGISWCRYRCGEKDMGASCMSDGVYIYPEKLSHYLEHHHVRLPDEFVEHIKTYEPVKILSNLSQYTIDYDWWKQQQGFNNHVTSKSYLAATDEELIRFEKRKTTN